MIIYIPNNNTPEKEYIIGQIFSNFLSLDYKIKFDNQVDNYIIKHGEKEIVIKDDFFSRHTEPLSYLSKTNIPEKIEYGTVLEIKELPIIYGEDKFDYSENKIYCGVDVFASAFFMLTRWEEFVLSREEIGKCEEQDLLCVKSGLTKEPIVNIYCDFLVKMLNKIGVGAKVCSFQSVRITHDVDRCRLSSFYELLKNLFPLAFRHKQYKKALIAFKNYLLYKIERVNPFDCFDEIMDYSDKYGIRNFFYFKACEKGEGGYTYDVREEKIAKSILNIYKRGHKIGFHPSENTFNNDAQFTVELSRLSSIINNGDIKGGRNHGLFYNMNTFKQWTDNLEYDSGIGYQYYNGFRSGICFPYEVFDVFNRKTLDLLEFPFVAMDSVAIRQKWSPKEAYENVIKIIDIVNRYEGTLVLNWHSNLLNANERKNYKQVYFDIIDYVAERKK